MADLTTLLSKFLNDLYAGVIGSTSTITGFRNGDGTSAAPSYSFADDPNTGWYRAGDAGTGAVIRATVNGQHMLTLDVAGGLFLPLNTASLNLGATSDVSLSRGAANRLDLASGDSFRLVSGVVTGGGLISRRVTVTTDATAGIISYSAAQVAGGLILRDCAGAGRADTVPTAAALLAVIPGAQVGQGVPFTIRNTSAGATSITVSTNTGVTLSGTMTIAQNNSKDFLAVFTNVTAASEAYTLYSLGTTVF